VNGLGSESGNASNGGNADGASATLPEQLVSSALRFRAQAPLVDSLLKEIGIDGSGIEHVTQSLMSEPSSITN
jgi:hypothetical protein